MIHAVKLKNGLNLITLPKHETKAMTIMALLPVGSRFESDKLAGASHFVEHMLFKGTKKRPTYLHISRALDAVGAQYNAFTGKDYTGYYIKIAADKQELAFDVLSDIVFNSVFDEGEIGKEKGVIVEELRMYDDNPTMKIDSLYEELIFKGHALGRDIGGSAQTVRALTRPHLFDYYQTYYRPGNAVLVLAGNIDQKNEKKFLRYFTDVKPGRPLKNWRAFDRFKFTAQPAALGERVNVLTKKLDQAHLILGFPGIHYLHPKRYVLSVLLSVLSGGMSSRLFVEVREKRGLAYVIRAAAGAYADAGSVYVQAGLDPQRIPEALRVIKDELKLIGRVAVGADELNDAKNNLTGQLALSLEDSSELAGWYAKKFWFDKSLETPEQFSRKIQAVTAVEVQKLAAELFQFNKMRAALISSLDKKELVGMLK